MMTILIAVALFLLAVAGMALGLVLRRKPLGGSCGNCSNCIVREAGS
ncbi:MAG: hypothetical protein GY815_05775 [Gammaproteobacteria bacterium]|nr:hypothetical protein [Gammaproteobacteria bacterium]